MLRRPCISLIIGPEVSNIKIAYRKSWHANLLQTDVKFDL